MDEYLTWEEFSQKDKSATEWVLFQCIISLSGLPGYTGMTPWEIYEDQVQQARRFRAILEELTK